MKLSKRERTIAIVAGATFGLLALQFFVVGPYFEVRGAVVHDREQAQQQLDDADALFARQRRLRPIWTELQSGGLKANESEADSQMYQAILGWARLANIKFAAFKPERTSAENKFQVINYDFSGTGSVRSISRLLWSIETEAIPVRVNEVQITPRREGTDDLSIRLSVSTLCLPPDANGKVASSGNGGTP